MTEGNVTSSATQTTQPWRRLVTMATRLLLAKLQCITVFMVTIRYDTIR